MPIVLNGGFLSTSIVTFISGMEHYNRREEARNLGIRFFDYDDILDKDVEIKGKSFELMLDICFRYSERFSFYFDDCNPRVFPGLDTYMVSKRRTLPIGRPCGGWIKIYSCCEESKKEILNVSDNFWDLWGAWTVHNPEDLTFYRSDHTVFFISDMSEGYGTFYPRRDEDVSAFFKAVDFHTEINTIQIVEDRYQ